jgi:hypothetical protein
MIAISKDRLQKMFDAGSFALLHESLPQTTPTFERQPILVFVQILVK